MRRMGDSFIKTLTIINTGWQRGLNTATRTTNGTADKTYCVPSWRGRVPLGLAHEVIGFTRRTFNYMLEKHKQCKTGGGFVGGGAEIGGDGGLKVA